MMNQLPPGRLVVFVCLVAGSLALDLGTKQAAFDKLGLGGHTDWMLNSWVRFRLQTNLNQGALWGMGQGFAPAFAALSVVAFVGILYWLFVMKAARSLWLTIALAFVSGGTLGNLYDRLGLHGVRLPGGTEPALAVRDFLHFQFGTFDWPIFNVADICLVTGAVMLMLQSLMSSETERAPESAPGCQSAELDSSPYQAPGVKTSLFTTAQPGTRHSRTIPDTDF